MRRYKRCAERTFTIAGDQHVAKFNRLMEARECILEQQSNTVDRGRWLVRLYSQDLTEVKETVLCRGLNFWPAPQKIPTLEIAAVVGVDWRMNELEATELCGSVCSILKRSKPPPPTIKDERVALRTLKEKNNIVILPVDKWTATVVMETSDFVKAR